MSKYTNIDVEERVNRGVDLFKEGYNCSQSVVGAFADLYNMPQDVAMHVAASFGAGLGRMRLTCGAVSGMCLLAGLECGTADPKDNAAKGHNYAVVQDLVNQFREINGSSVCSELLGRKKEIKESPLPNERNAEYYAKRPCAKMVATACEIYSKYLQSL